MSLLDANTPAAAVVVKAGGPVTWVYKVTATTQMPVGNVVLVDDSGTAANPADDRTLVLQSGDTNNNGLLDPGETWIYTLTGTAPAGWFENIAKVSGVANGINVYDDDPAWIYGAAPDIKLVKAVNAVDPWHPTPTEDANGTARAARRGRLAGRVHLSDQQPRQHRPQHLPPRARPPATPSRGSSATTTARRTTRPTTSRRRTSPAT